MAAGEFLDREAAPPFHTGNRTAVSTSSASSVVSHSPVKNSAAATRAARAATAPRTPHPGPGRRPGIRRRVGMGERAADGSAVADLEVPDERRRPRQQRNRSAHVRIGAMAACVVAAPIHSRRRCARCPAARQAGDVDEVIEGGEPKRQHRHQALAAREDFRASRQFGQQATASSTVSAGGSRTRRVSLRRLASAARRSTPGWPAAG